jgi:hypothetical protein
MTTNIFSGFRLVFAASLLAGVAQVAVIRELSAYHRLSAMDMSVRLVALVITRARPRGVWQ